MMEDSHKAAFRRWARENHPDVGGDPAVFAEGLRAVREGRWAQFETGAAADAGEGTDTAQPPESRTTIYVRRSARGVAKVIVAAQRWNARRRQPPRVR